VPPMTDEQFRRLSDLIGAQDSLLESLSQRVIELLERECDDHSDERPRIIDCQEETNNLVESLKRAKHAKNVALKFLKNS